MQLVLREMATKTCPLCGETKTLKDGFEVHRRNISGETVYRRSCRTCRLGNKKAGYHAVWKIREGLRKRGELVEPPKQDLVAIPDAKCYVITWAQNATRVHPGFWASIKNYARHRKAEICVIPGMYHNPTSWWSTLYTHDRFWADEVAPYLVSGTKEIGEHLAINAASIQPTNKAPTNGFERQAASRSIIIGHPRQDLQAIASHPGELPRIVAASGACTIPHYINALAGERSSASHTLGALIVEIDKDGLFHLRQVQSSQDGSFTDLAWRYTPEGREKAPRAAAIVLGDAHVVDLEKPVLDATKAIMRDIKPEHIVMHDLLSGDGWNHHSGFWNKFRAESTRLDPEKEIEACLRFVDDMQSKSKAVIVSSNHHDHVDRWMLEKRVADIPQHADFYVRAWRMALDAANGTVGRPQVFRLIGKERLPSAEWLATDESYVIAGSEVGFHGHHGINGARAGKRTYASLGIKTVTGHTHVPMITGPHYQAGCSCSTKLDYQAGPSNRLNSHVVIYADGSRTLVNIIKGKWRG